MNAPWNSQKAELSESKVKSWQLTIITVVCVVTAALLDRLGSGADITGPILLIAGGCAASLQTRRVAPPSAEQPIAALPSTPPPLPPNPAARVVADFDAMGGH